MATIIPQNVKKQPKKWVIVGAVSLLVIVLVGIGVWALTSRTQTHKSTSSNNSDTSTASVGTPSLSPAAQNATQLANSQATGGDTAGAIKTLSDAVAQATTPSDKASLYTQQSAVYTQTNQFGAAIAADQQAIAANPSDWNGYANIGYLYKHTGDMQNAISSFKKALSLMNSQTDPGDVSEIKGALAMAQAGQQ